MTTPWDCYHASGSRRACAGLAVANALNAADVVAVIVATEHQARVAQLIRRELDAASGVRVLPVEGTRAPWLDQIYADWGLEQKPEFGLNLDALADVLHGVRAADPSVRRSVLVWEGVDGFIHGHDDRFEPAAALLAESASGSAPQVWGRSSVQKVVLVGGDALLARLNRLLEALPEETRFRYILVH